MSRIEVCFLGSGSSGNCAVVRVDETSVLVDAGLSTVETERRLALRGMSLDAISAIFLTHEHADHVHAALDLNRRRGIPVFASRGTAVAGGFPGPLFADVRAVAGGTEMTLGDLHVRVTSDAARRRRIGVLRFRGRERAPRGDRHRSRASFARRPRCACRLRRARARGESRRGSPAFRAVSAVPQEAHPLRRGAPVERERRGGAQAPRRTADGRGGRAPRVAAQQHERARRARLSRGARRDGNARVARGRPARCAHGLDLRT